MLAPGVAEYVQIDGNPDDIPNGGLRVTEATDSVGCGARDEIRVVKIRINAAVTRPTASSFSSIGTPKMLSEWDRDVTMTQFRLIICLSKAPGSRCFDDASSRPSRMTKDL